MRLTRITRTGGGLTQAPAPAGLPGAPVAEGAPPQRARRQLPFRRSRSQLLVLAPSFLVLGIFVYGFIAYTIRVSLSKWQGVAPTLQVEHPLGTTFKALAQTPRFQADMRNVVIFTVLFLLLAILAGLVLALLVHDTLIARGLFRSVFLFPYALSFIVTGVVWRWIFTPSTGANLILDKLGIHHGPKWITDPTVVGDVSKQLDAIIPGGHFIQVKLGIPEGLTLVEVSYRLRHSRAYIGNDSGITHLAAFLGVPTVALFGPTDPRIWGPMGRRSRVIWKRTLEDISVDEILLAHGAHARTRVDE